MMKYFTECSIKAFWLLSLILAGSASLSASFTGSNLFCVELRQNWQNQDPDTAAKLLWQPELDWHVAFSDQIGIKLLASARSSVYPINPSSMNTQLYRIWSSVNLKGYNLSLGLQRLNFGTADLIRPLQWFDGLNPLDDREETEAVRAVVINLPLGQNGSLKGWGIYSSNRLKGNEIYPSQTQKIEPGGRLELPLGNLNSAISYHYRQALSGSDRELEEHRLGIDLRWDGLIGAWLESSSSTYLDTSSQEDEYQVSISLGSDYTIEWGNGIYLRQETGSNHIGNNLSELRNQNLGSALLLSYPLGLLDKIQALTYYDWNRGKTKLFVQYSRIYDFWSIVMGAGYQIDKGELPELRVQVAYNI